MVTPVFFSVDIKGAKHAKTKPPRYTLKKCDTFFKAGKYPDKDFELREDEIDAVVAGFSKAIDLDSEHKGSIFDGKLGKLIKVEKNADNKTFAGYVAVPDWLESLVPEEDQKLSVSFDKATKQIIGCAWTNNPRITEANLAANFMADETANGELPGIEDAPTPKPGGGGDGEGEDMEGQELLSHICELLKKARAKANPKINSQDYIDSLDDMIAECEDYAGGSDGGDDDKSGGDNSKTEKDDKDKANMSKTKQQPVNFNKDRSNAAALREFNNLVKDRRVLPRQKDTFLAAYSKFDERDAVSFSKGETGDLLDTYLKEMWSHEQHNLTSEQLAQGGGTAVIDAATFNKEPKDGKDGEKPMTEERRTELLSASRLGREIVANRNSNGKK